VTAERPLRVDAQVTEPQHALGLLRRDTRLGATDVLDERRPQAGHLTGTLASRRRRHRVAHLEIVDRTDGPAIGSYDRHPDAALTDRIMARSMHRFHPVGLPARVPQETMQPAL
jgi:hypothetical protein